MGITAGTPQGGIFRRGYSATAGARSSRRFDALQRDYQSVFRQGHSLTSIPSASEREIEQSGHLLSDLQEHTNWLGHSHLYRNV
jgi:hypothetical protein